MLEPGRGQGSSHAVRRLTAISTGPSRVCAIDTDQVIHCWGSNDPGPEEVPSGRFSAVTVGENHVCALRAVGGTVVCWGSNAKWNRRRRSARGQKAPCQPAAAPRIPSSGVSTSGNTFFPADGEPDAPGSALDVKRK